MRLEFVNSSSSGASLKVFTGRAFYAVIFRLAELSIKNKHVLTVSHAILSHAIQPQYL